MASLVRRCSSQPFLPFSISRQAYTLISYQGHRPEAGASITVDLKPWTANANFASTRTRHKAAGFLQRGHLR